MRLHDKIVFPLFSLLILSVFLLTFFSSNPYIKGFQFDSQNILVWKYTASLSLMPYRDIFYPYGFLSYYAEQFTVLKVINSCIPSFMLIGMFVGFRKITRKSIVAFMYSACYILFVISVSDLTTFSRYGISLITAFLLGAYYNELRQAKVKVHFLLGFLVSTAFSLIPDQGLYLGVLLFISYLSTGFLSHRKEKKNNFQLLAKQGLGFFVGGMLGLVPLLLFLVLTHSYTQFIISFRYLSAIALFAKTPYFHSLRSFPGICNLLMVVSSLSFLSITFQKRHKIVGWQVIYFLVVVLILLEQKSLIRSIDNQLILVSLLLLFTYSWSVSTWAKINVRTVYVLGYSVVGLSLVFLIFNKFNTMTTANPSELKTVDAYAQVVNTVKSYSSTAKIFSFPGDPIYYLYFNQNTPYYLTAYESSPLSAQKKIISYIENENIRFVIYHFTQQAIQDGVPDAFRISTEYRYLLTHFHPREKIGEFLILEKNSTDMDFFSRNFSLPQQLKDSLLTVNMEFIPKTEGMYKQPVLTTVMNTNSHDELQEKLLKRNVFSRNTVISIKNTNNSQPVEKITIRVRGGLETTISYKSCTGSTPCVINLANIPLFYTNRQIVEARYDEKSVALLTISTVNDRKLLY